MKYIECLVRNNRTNKVEVMELTETMAENLSEIATVMSVNFIGGKSTVWKDGVARVVPVDEGAIMELKRRIVWREAHAGMLS